MDELRTFRMACERAEARHSRLMLDLQVEPGWKAQHRLARAERILALRHARLDAALRRKALRDLPVAISSGA